MGKGGRKGFGGAKKDRIADAYAEKRSSQVSHFGIFLKSLPYLWPPNAIRLHLLLIASILFMIVSSACELYAPLPMRQIVTGLTPSQNTTSVYFSKSGFFMFAVVTVGGAAAARFRDMCFGPVSAETERSIGIDSFRHLQELSLSFHMRRETGGILRSISRGSGTYSALIKSTMFILLPMLIKVVVTCIIFAVLFKWYFFVIIVVFLAFYVLYSTATSVWRDQYRRIMNEKDNEKNNRVFDTLLNFETMKYFNAERHEEIRFNETSVEFAEAEVNTQNVYSLTSLGQSFISNTALLLVVYIAGHQVVGHELTLADFVMIYQYLQNLYQPLELLGKLYLDLKQQILDAESMFFLLDEPVEVNDKPNAAPFQMAPDEQAEIEFRNVSFTYQKKKDSGKVQLINNLSFSIKPGEKVAIVGPSGVGKSTLTRLLYRMYDIDGGAILINGVNIADMTQESLRRQIGIVPQDTVLFNNTIGYNVAYGCATHDATPHQIMEVSKRAAIHDFIVKQPNGYDTDVGERGMRLSGGEKQRVSIARAVLKDPKIMIFDEATSSLDSMTEAQILVAMNDIAKGRTCLTIAHRLSTVMGADKILVLNKGALVETGTHEELLKLDDGMYKSLWNQQQQIANLQRDLEAAHSLALGVEDDVTSDESEPHDEKDSWKTKKPKWTPPPPRTTSKPSPVDAKDKLSESFPSQTGYSTFDSSHDTDRTTGYTPIPTEDKEEGSKNEGFEE